MVEEIAGNTDRLFKIRMRGEVKLASKMSFHLKSILIALSISILCLGTSTAIGDGMSFGSSSQDLSLLSVVDENHQIAAIN
jgi:hypothetical protein